MGKTLELLVVVVVMVMQWGCPGAAAQMVCRGTVSEGVEVFIMAVPAVLL
jgi:hypothetical protein